MLAILTISPDALQATCHACKTLSADNGMGTSWYGMVLRWHDRGRHRWVHMIGCKAGWLIHDGFGYSALPASDVPPTDVAVRGDRRAWTRIPNAVRARMDIG